MKLPIPTHLLSATALGSSASSAFLSAAEPQRRRGNAEKSIYLKLCVISASLCLCGKFARAQVPSTDARLTTIPHTDTHFTPRTYRTLAEWQEHRAHLRKQILSAAGLLPMPTKTPLHPQIFGRIENRTYSIEKVLLETLPGYYLGGNLYRPLNKPAPAAGFPAIVSPHGHWNQGRLENTAVASIPARCINLAQQGYVVFAYDMVGYNDTIQTPHEFETREFLLWDFGPYALQLWNSIRAVDFLESLPEVNKQMIGATGASGGGTQTFSLAAVDDRIQFAAPVNMISLIMQGGAICENAASLRFDTNNVEIASMFAPKPMIMVGATGDWTKNTATEEYPAVKAIYQLYDKPENVEMFFQDAPHNYNQAAREAVYTFFGKTVLGLPGPIKERNIRMEQPSNMLALFNRKLPDNALDFPSLFAEWKQIARDAAGSVTARAQVREMLELALGAEWPAKVIAETSGERFALSRPGRGDRVAGIFHPGRGANILIVNPEGTDALRRTPLFDEFVQSGRPIYAIDAFQTGAAVAPRNSDVKMFLTFNRSDDANRVQDILTTLAWLNSPNAEVVGIGKAAVWSLFAASLSRQSVILNLDIPKPGSVDKDYYDNFFVPGIERAGGLRAARLLTNQ